MRLYELVVVMRTSLSEKERKSLLDSVKSFLKDTKITKEEDWGQKPFAFKIKHDIAGVYHMMHIETENAVTGLENKLRGNDAILRYLLIRKK